MKALVTLTVVLLVAGISQASLLTVIEPGVSVGTDSFGRSLTMYRIHFVASTTDDWVSSLDGRFDGPMNQWNTSGSRPKATPTLETAWDLDEPYFSQDSHLNVYNAMRVEAQEPLEDKDAFNQGSWLANSTTLNFAYGIKGPYQTSDLDFAQIVTIGTYQVTYVGHCARNNLPGVPVEFTVGIPEPATLAMLTLGCAGALLRRRRRS